METLVPFNCLAKHAVLIASLDIVQGAVRKSKSTKVLSAVSCELSKKQMQKASLVAI